MGFSTWDRMVAVWLRWKDTEQRQETVSLASLLCPSSFPTGAGNLNFLFLLCDGGGKGTHSSFSASLYPFSLGRFILAGARVLEQLGVGQQSDWRGGPSARQSFIKHLLSRELEYK